MSKISNNGSNGHNGNNGNNGYSAAAGITTVEEDDEATKVVNKQVAAVADDDGIKVGEAVNVKKVETKKGRGGTVVKIVAFVGGLVILSILGLSLFFSDGSGKRTVKTNVPNRVGQPATESDEKLTADAIAHTRSQVAPSPAAVVPGAVVAQPGAAPPAIIVQSEPVVPTKVGTTTLNGNANTSTANTPVVQTADGVAGTVNANSNANSNAKTASSTAPRSGSTSAPARSRTTGARPSRANGQKSLVFGGDAARSDDGDNNDGSRAGQSRPVNAGFAIGTAGSRNVEAPMMAVRPSFGSLLPVRTLGAIYTLRTGALVRMELTRDVSGNGWKLPRRTVIVGTLRGGEFDRAYVSVVGYIDSASGRLVTFGGSLLGSDAGEGMKGERRQVTSRWSRILGTLAERGFALAQTTLGRNGGATIVLGDAARPEINALTQNGDRREFVAVKAGSMGYVSVTDLPREVEGIDALSQMNPDALAQLLNSGANTGTGLSDDEVAQLLASGSNVQIRSAMPRMNENMRRVAEQVISQSER